MKKFLLVAVITVCSFANLNAQGIELGLSGALPIGDAGDGYSFGVILDGSYLFEVADGILVGPTTGVMHYFGSTEDLDTGFGTVEVDFDDATFIPIGATGRVMLGDAFYFGADVGYGIGVAPDGNDGGFLYRPRTGYMVGEKVAISLSYSGVSFDGGSFTSINGGVAIKL